MQRINQVLLVPEITSRTCGRFSEQEMIDGYVQSLFEHLEEDRIAVSLYEEGEPVLPGTLVMHCLGGFLTKATASKSNMTIIKYGADHAYKFADILQVAVNDWGRCYGDFHHKSALPKQNLEDMYLNYPDTLSVSISPFKINGPSAESYMSKLDPLGKTISHCIWEYLGTRQELPKVVRVAYK